MEQPLTDLSSWRADRCSLAKAIDLVGTRSAMLILREAYYGTTRFDGFASRVGITEAVAAKQLRRLTEAGLLTKQPYRELGADYLDRINAAQLKRYFVKRLENLGLQVIVQNIEKAAPLPT